jgi:hypothetical protein
MRSSDCPAKFAHIAGQKRGIVDRTEGSRKKGETVAR